MILSSYGILTSQKRDSDAQAFIEAAGLTGATDISAIEYLTSGLKVYGLWEKMKAVYPIIGDTATTQKWNLMNPQDTDAAYRLLFVGGWTHIYNGATPNGINAYADTFLTPSTALTTNNTHISYYSRTDDWGPTKYWIDMGANTNANQRTTLIIRWVNNILYGDMNGATTAGRVQWNSTGIITQAYYLLSRTSSTSLKAYRNASLLATNTNAHTDPLPDRKILLAAQQQDDGTITGFAGRKCIFSSIGDGLNDTEVSNLNIVVQQYNKILGRQASPY